MKITEEIIPKPKMINENMSNKLQSPESNISDDNCEYMSDSTEIYDNDELPTHMDAITQTISNTVLIDKICQTEIKQCNDIGVQCDLIFDNQEETQTNNKKRKLIRINSNEFILDENNIDNNKLYISCDDDEIKFNNFKKLDNTKILEDILLIILTFYHIGIEQCNLFSKLKTKKFSTIVYDTLIKNLSTIMEKNFIKIFQKIKIPFDVLQQYKNLNELNKDRFIHEIILKHKYDIVLEFIPDKYVSSILTAFCAINENSNCSEIFKHLKIEVLVPQLCLSKQQPSKQQPSKQQPSKSSKQQQSKSSKQQLSKQQPSTSKQHYQQHNNNNQQQQQNHHHQQQQHHHHHHIQQQQQQQQQQEDQQQIQYQHQNIYNTNVNMTTNHFSYIESQNSVIQNLNLPENQRNLNEMFRSNNSSSNTIQNNSNTNYTNVPYYQMENPLMMTSVSNYLPSSTIVSQVNQQQDQQQHSFEQLSPTVSNFSLNVNAYVAQSNNNVDFDLQHQQEYQQQLMMQNIQQNHQPEEEQYQFGNFLSDNNLPQLTPIDLSHYIA